MTEPLTEQQLAEWERLAREATEPPWRACQASGGCRCGMVWATTHDALVMVAGHHVDGERCVKEGPQSAANAAFAAAARDAVPALAAEVRRLRQAEHDLRADCQQKLSAAYLEAAMLRKQRGPT